MNSKRTIRTALLALTLAGFGVAAPEAQAQCNQCGDVWINELFKSVHGRCPNGSGKNVGECDINRYGGGSWSSKQQLENFIRYSKSCSDPWVGEAVFQVTGRAPRQAECNTSLYPRWSSYPDLVSKVRTAQTAPVAATPVLNLTAGLSVTDGNGRTLYPASSIKLVDPAGVIGQNGATIMAGASRLITDNGAGFSLQSAGGGRVLGTIRGADGKTYKVVLK